MDALFYNKTRGKLGNRTHLVAILTKMDALFYILRLVFQLFWNVKVAILTKMDALFYRNCIYYDNRKRLSQSSLKWMRFFITKYQQRQYGCTLQVAILTKMDALFYIITVMRDASTYKGRNPH